MKIEKVGMVLSVVAIGAAGVGSLFVTAKIALIALAAFALLAAVAFVGCGIIAIKNKFCAAKDFKNHNTRPKNSEESSEEQEINQETLQVNQEQIQKEKLEQETFQKTSKELGMRKFFESVVDYDVFGTLPQSAKDYIKLLQDETDFENCKNEPLFEETNLFFEKSKGMKKLDLTMSKEKAMSMENASFIDHPRSIARLSLSEGGDDVLNYAVNNLKVG